MTSCRAIGLRRRLPLRSRAHERGGVEPADLTISAQANVASPTAAAPAASASGGHAGKAPADRCAPAKVRPAHAAQWARTA